MVLDDVGLADFRFQAFCNDTIYSVYNERVRISDRDVRAFASGELREAVSMAAIGVACGIYRPQPFSRMLDIVKRELDGKRTGRVAF